MSKLTEKVRSLFHRQRPVSREDAAEIADWVDEGGAFSPEGPPPVNEEKDDQR